MICMLLQLKNDCRHRAIVEINQREYQSVIARLVIPGSEQKYI